MIFEVFGLGISGDELAPLMAILSNQTISGQYTL